MLVHIILSSSPGLLYEHEGLRRRIVAMMPQRLPPVVHLQGIRVVQASEQRPMSPFLILEHSISFMHNLFIDSKA